MKLTIQGEEELYGRFKSLNKVMQKTFWGLVRTDLETTLLKNVKPNIKTGKLERNIYSKIVDNGVEAGVRNEGMLVGKGVNYAVFLNEGTKAHDIRPKNKKALRWVGPGGAFMFAKSVRHPGTKGTHFIEKSAKATFSRLDSMFTQALKQEGL